MIVTAILALDFGLLRITYRRSELPYDLGALSLVPCLQIAALLAFPRRGPRRPFWLGFLASGSLVLLLYSGVRGPFHRFFEWLSTLVHEGLVSLGPDVTRIALNLSEPANMVIYTAYGIVLIGLPLLVIPTLVGVLAHFAAMRLARRPPATP